MLLCVLLESLYLIIYDLVLVGASMMHLQRCLDDEQASFPDIHITMLFMTQMPSSQCRSYSPSSAFKVSFPDALPAVFMKARSFLPGQTHRDPMKNVLRD